MSSMRNAIQRRPHRERAQPLARRRLGLLEKHKDYSLRAKDYNKKQAQLKSLRQKAADRNEDEFYFGMMSRKGPGSRLKDGKNWRGTALGDRGNKALDVETVRLLKTQDVGYVRTMRQVVSKEVARLEEQVVLTRGLARLDADRDGGRGGDGEAGGRPARRKQPRKIVFLDDEDERSEAMRDAAAQGEQEGRGEEQGEDKASGGEDEDEGMQSLRSLERHLENSRKKLKALTDAEHELGVQRAKMAKTATSGGYTRKGHKIMVRARKR